MCQDCREEQTFEGDYREEVARGAALLDQTLSGDWRSRIDKEELDMSNGRLCVLGQLFNNGDDIYENGYVIGRKILGLDNSDDTRNLGFNININDWREDRWDILQAAWLEVLGPVILK